MKSRIQELAEALADARAVSDHLKAVDLRAAKGWMRDELRDAREQAEQQVSRLERVILAEEIPTVGAQPRRRRSPRRGSQSP